MLPKGPYDPNTNEPIILKYWLDNKFFKPEYHSKRGLLSTEEMKNDGREPFCIINPPPNAYMRPHIGNVSGYAYQDVFLRYNRLLGKKVLGQPGKDHAGIQGEVVVEKIFIENKGKTKYDMGREKFYLSAYDHFQKLMPKVMADEQRIGLSSDYDRNIFTLDPKIVDTVIGTFIKMFQDKMVYKGVRIVNWDPVAKTTLADIDTERVERETELVYIKYPLKESVDGVDFISVATTRAETMLGDTAVIVHPEDPRYKNLIGKSIILPITNREVPIIASVRVEKEFGTGAVKLTPAHSYDDYVMMTEWNSENPNSTVGYINIIDKDGKMTGPIPEHYLGMTTSEARNLVEHELGNLVLKREKHLQSVMVGERSKAVIEQIMSSQWFIDVEKLKQPAITAVNDGKVTIYPEYMTKKYLTWLENLRDWPVSRSLWWGYRFPVWYKGKVEEKINDNGQLVETIDGVEFKDIVEAVEKSLAKVQIENPNAEGENTWIQDEDVFDTWFSSGQWPYATLKANDLIDTFFPSDIMETGYDILELWVSRMIMLSLYHEGKEPFKNVYLHGLVKAPDGQKMSKSKNNVIVPDEIINKYGADSLRLLYIVGNAPGQPYPISYEKLEGYKRFLNKIWNASKFVLSYINENDLDIIEITTEDVLNKAQEKGVFISERDKEMINKVDELSKSVTKQIEKFRIGLAAEELYQEFWHDFCDVYIEEIKPKLYSKDREGNEINTSTEALNEMKSAKLTMFYVLKRYLVMLHPLVPFITETVWQEMPKTKEESKTIMYSTW
jgi:valyl-tRNA synthetase